MSEVRLECVVCQGQESFLKDELTYHLMSHSVLQLALALVELQLRLDQTAVASSSSEMSNTPTTSQLEPEFPPDKLETEVKPSQQSVVKKPSKTPSSRSPHTCEVCKKVLSSRGALVKHLITHKEKKPFQCEECHAQFNQNRDLNTHKMQKHTLQRPHVCGICGKGFVHKFYLMEHMNYHTGERAHQCSICGKTFPALSALTKHTARHSSTRNFACHLCAKCFVVKKDLNVHVKLVHEKPREGRGIPTRDSLDISFEFQEWPGKTEPTAEAPSTTSEKTEPEPELKEEKNTNALLDKDWLEDEDKKRFLDQWMDSPVKSTSTSNNSESGPNSTLVIPNIHKLSDPNNSS